MDQANNVNEFLKIIDRYKGYKEIFYRGQESKYKNITASISRDEGHMVYESKIYNESIDLRKSDFESLTLPIENLAKLQHYGFPTRLIDFTIDALTALYFSVENIESECAGLVYLFIQPGEEIHSKQIQLLSLLATLKEQNIDTIQKKFYHTYNTSISEEEILNLCGKTSFIKRTDELRKSNTRLYNQQGTFAICGNYVEDRKLSNKIKPLDIKPTLAIKIPYEYKEAIKKELDQQYQINKTIVYPELISAADYIKEKYKEKNISLDGTYSLVDVKDISYPRVKRISIKIVLAKLLKIDEIHMVIKQNIRAYKQKYDVINIFVAKNNDDYIMNNWIIRGQWLNPFNDKIKMLPLGETDGTGYSWQLYTGYSVRSEFNNKYVFEDDKKLFISHQKIFSDFYSNYKKMLHSFEQNKYDLISYLRCYEEEVCNLSIIIGDLGVSRNKKLDDLLNLYNDYFMALYNLTLWVKNNNPNLKQRSNWAFLQRKFNEIIDYVKKISTYSGRWEKRLGVSGNDYELIDPYNNERPKYQFVPTIPINPNALIVDFSLQIKQTENNSLFCYGETNLYDTAQLLLTLSTKNGKVCGQNKAIVYNSKFDFGKFSIKGEGYKPGNYNAKITLSIPNTQKDEFKNKAGIEYENLNGELVFRDGIGPTIKYKKEFVVN